MTPRNRRKHRKNKWKCADRRFRIVPYQRQFHRLLALGRRTRKRQHKWYLIARSQYQQRRFLQRLRPRSNLPFRHLVSTKVDGLYNMSPTRQDPLRSLLPLLNFHRLATFLNNAKPLRILRHKYPQCARSRYPQQRIAHTFRQAM